MKTHLPPLAVGLALIALSTLNSQLSTCFAQGTGFTYQGLLDSSGAPYTGSAEFQATLWNAVSGGAQVAANNPATVTAPVTNGLFVLPLDFGANFPGADRWLQLNVRTTLGPFTTLSPRQRLTPTPYAITAGNALTAATLSGTVPPEALANAWKTSGNSGTSPGTHFLGTTDGQPLELRAAGVGIGTSNPQFPLDVAGAVRITNPGDGAVALNLSIERSWAFRQLGSGSSTALELASVGGGGNKNFVINTTGNVGIGTTAPEVALDVAGRVRIYVPPLTSDPSLILTTVLHTLALGNSNRIDATGGIPISPSTLWLNRNGGRVAVGAVVSIGGNTRFKVVNATCDGSSWINASDRNLKENFEPADPQAVLARVAALPIHRWSYTNSPDARHLGPTAQDFHAAFGLGDDDKTIATVDSGGVALAAIQGLNQRLTEELKRRDAENSELKQELRELKRLVGSLGKLNGEAPQIP